jgi:hypothetical protein
MNVQSANGHFWPTVVEGKKLVFNESNIKTRVAPPVDKRIAYPGGDAGREILPRCHHDRIF